MRFGTALTYAAFPDGGGVSRAARSARVSQLALNINSERMRAAEHAPYGPFQILECPHGLADIVERCVGVRSGTKSGTSPGHHRMITNVMLKLYEYRNVEGVGAHKKNSSLSQARRPPRPASGPRRATPHPSTG